MIKEHASILAKKEGLHPRTGYGFFKKSQKSIMLVHMEHKIACYLPIKCIELIFLDSDMYEINVPKWLCDKNRLTKHLFHAAR